MGDVITVENISVAAAVNDNAVLEGNLLRSPLLSAGGVKVILQRGFPSASAAYNAAMQKCDSPVIIFAHQDVYIPAGWEKRLLEAIACIGRDWAVLGIIGKDPAGGVVGRAWSTGIGKEVGYGIKTPCEAAVMDELVLVMNARAGIVFDERLAGYHFYGTDIVQIARSGGLKTYIFDAPVIHNSLPVVGVDPSFEEGYHYLQKKWKARLPLNHLIVPITRWGWPLWKYKFRQQRKKLRERSHYQRLSDPQAKAKQLGYE